MERLLTLIIIITIIRPWWIGHVSRLFWEILFSTQLYPKSWRRCFNMYHRYKCHNGDITHKFPSYLIVYEVSIIDSSVCFPLSATCLDLALRSKILFLSLSIFNFTITTYKTSWKKLVYKWLKYCLNLHM